MNWWGAASGAAWSWEWRAYPGVWLFVGLIAAAYFTALRRLAPARLAADEAPAAPRDVVRFVLGLVALWVAADWPVGLLAAGYLLSARTAQYGLCSAWAKPAW